MGTAVLRSHDCLKHDFFDSRPPPMNASSRKKLSRSPQPKRPNPARSKRRLASPDKENCRQPALVMGQVTILKRGEALMPKIPDLRSDGQDPSALCSTNRMGPDPGILPKISDLKAVYAGPAFISSPSPSSVPIPAFFLKKSAAEASKSEIARGLRCLLRLDDVA